MGSLSQISVGDVNNVWGVNELDQIYSYNNAAASWTLISGNLGNVWATFDGAVWGVNANGSLYKWNGSSFGFVANGVSYVVSGNATNVWAVNATSGAVYAWF